MSRYNGRVARVHQLDDSAREAILNQLRRALSARDDVAFAAAHGSFLRPGAFRDIDVAVWATPQASPRLDDELAVQLTRMTGIPIDVRIINRAPVAFLFHALRGRLIAVRDERVLADVIEGTARVYHDRAPLVRRATREAFAA